MLEHEKNQNVICLESLAFYKLVEEVVERITQQQMQKEEKWVDDDEAMRLLHITSRTTLQKYRDDGSIRFTQPSRKVILYDRNSIFEFLERHAKDTF